ncbi:hypothetical protein FB382_003075 [Nocardioides ginsengisegetis]|uniref:Uncharacterized protein n=1 Tax=Nocardioides ginsengisegetis TaxID=661491 RepID=A0A7W3J229_9ACTN|nr:hypothetical protein [Nocardioides ginsengisegetis]MBA8804784.1 hypothetical protein [Nocardioides ginsengisegetis]
MGSQGKRAGSRRGPKQKAPARAPLLGLALGVTLSVVAWGYLVYAAIDFGASARGGERNAWYFLGLASLGAVACLFMGLMLVARLLRRLGITSGPRPPRPWQIVEDDEPEAPLDATREITPIVRPPGGRRAAR